MAPPLAPPAIADRRPTATIDVSPADGAPPGRRATGTSLIALVTVLVSIAGMVVLHSFRGDVSPLRDVMSHYANGSGGMVMSLVFYAFGITAVAIGIRLHTGLVRDGVTRLLGPLLWVGGGSLIAAGAFEVDRPQDAPTFGDVVHSDAAIAGFVLVIAAMWVLALGCRRDVRWWSFRRAAVVLAAVATAAGASNRLFSDLRWDGAVQRLLGVTVLAWELLVVLRVRHSRFERS